MRALWAQFSRSAGGPGDAGAQLVEFAFALPLLVLFVVGIFDFSGAFTLKQKLTNIARDAARASAADPSSDLLQPQTAAPGSVLDAFGTIDNYLLGTNLGDCGVALSGPRSGLTWTFVGHTITCPTPGLTIKINRGYYFPATGGTPPDVTCQPQSSAEQTALVGTCVSIQYPYRWKFGRAASLMGRTMTLPTQISAVAVALNEN